MRQGGEQATSLWMCSVSYCTKHVTVSVNMHASFMPYTFCAAVHPADPPELTTPLSPALLITGTSFSFNCTPSAANPPVDTVSIEVDESPVTSSDTVTVTDNVLTIASVQRSHSGNYSCTATNTRGSAVINQYLLVTDSGERAEATLSGTATPVVLLWLMRQTLNSCSNELQRCMASSSCSCVLQFLSLQELLFGL